MADVTLKQIAEIAGVSAATVSYVLSGKRKVSKATELRVLSVAKQLNYSPNLFAQQLKRGESFLIFALLNTYSSSFNGEALQKIEHSFEEKGYRLLAMTGGLDDIIRTNIFDGGIILNYHTTKQEIQTLEESTGKPLILLSNQSNQKNTASVIMDNFGGMKLVLAEFAKSEHQNICFIQGPEGSYNNTSRAESARYFYKELFQRDDFDIRLYRGNFVSDESYKLAFHLLKNKLYNAFVCFNDSTALGVYKAAYELGIQVGKDISVAGFDNTSYSEFVSPALTTVDVDKDLWAKEVVKNYLALKDRSIETNEVKIPASLIKRGSIKYKSI
ncbi:LacI family DNA-binding transcriptional regulator [Blautia liquoris]|uniref:LacI family DNA-binding transcriptional regulator n=1 Tax=Blautia liquoris TaxID=2779518 RepID=A0A7M2RFG1_9FIRM|nr:LacI family DNA-binding transcriptional regulator [Blautia liquoris]QOV18711.1 LacI family DNA-binding transcriptional regulator [Blautia liquoris]